MAVDDYPFSSATTGVVAPGAAPGGNIEVAGDKDMFGVSLTAGVTYVFKLERSAGGLGDPLLQLYSPTSALLAQDDNSGNDGNARLAYTASVTGLYFLGAMDAGAGTGGYRVSFTSSSSPAEAITVAAPTTVISEGDNAVFTVTAPVSLAGSTFSYSATGINLTDLQVPSLTGQYTLGADGHATISLPVVRDLLTEGTETLTLVLSSGNTAAVSIMDTSRPVVTMPAAVKTVLGIYSAFHGATPTAGVLASELALLNSSGSESAYAAAVAARFVNTPTQSLAGNVLNNVKITAQNTGGQTPLEAYTALRDALSIFFDAFVQSRGQVILNLTKILPTIESNATWGPAAIQFDNAIDQAYVALQTVGINPAPQWDA